MAELQPKLRNSRGDTRGMSANSRKNLIPCGNPAGRPKKAVCITSWLKEYAAWPINKPIDVAKLTYAQAAALSVWRSAAKGDLPSYNFIVDRTEGRAVERIAGADGGPIKIATAQELTDEELAVIVAQRTIANASRSGAGAANPAQG